MRLVAVVARCDEAREATAGARGACEPSSQVRRFPFWNASFRSMDAWTACLETALAAAVEKLAAQDRLTKVAITVQQPAGSVTVVAHARAPAKEVVASSQPRRHHNLDGERGPAAQRATRPQQSSHSSSSPPAAAQLQRRLLQGPLPVVESLATGGVLHGATGRRKKRLQLERKWRVRRLLALARIIFGGTFCRWVRTPREQRAARIRAVRQLVSF